MLTKRGAHVEAASLIAEAKEMAAQYGMPSVNRGIKPAELVRIVPVSLN